MRWPLGVSVNDNLQVLDLQRALLEVSPERRALAQSYRREIDQRQSVAAYLLLKEALRSQYGIAGNPQLALGPNGKPFLPDYPGIHFNLSHCRRAVACAVAESPVGVDIEVIAPVDAEVARQVLSATERREVERADAPEVAFARLWTRKEAVVKLTGEGIDRQRLPNLLAEVEGIKLETVENRAGGYVLTLATRVVAKTGKI